jgi:hypothetical protein
VPVTLATQGGRAQANCGSLQIVQETLSPKKPITKKEASGVVQGVDRVQAPVPPKKKKKKRLTI